MSLTNSNTYIEPTAATAIGTARGYQNDNFRSLLSNFYSTAVPTSVNLTADSTALAVPDGMLFRHETNGALYVSDSVNKQNAPLGGNFTRVGIGNRVEANLTVLQSNASTYEIGELAATIDPTNASLYLCKDNTGTFATDFVDISTPANYVIDGLGDVTITATTTTVGELVAETSANVQGSIYTDNYLIHNADSDTYLGFSANDTIVLRTGGVNRMTVNSSGASTFTGEVFIPSKLTHSGDTDTYLNFGTNTLSLYTGGSNRLHINSAGNIGINTSSPDYLLDVQKTGDTILRVKALSSGTGNDDDAVLLLDSTENGESEIRFRHNTTQKARIEWTQAVNNFNIVTEAGTLAPIDLQPNNVLALRATSDGYIGIGGMSSPTEALHVTGNGLFSGNVTAYSDIRLKTNVSTIDNALEKVLKLRGVYYDKEGSRNIGVIAQEIEQTLPEVVVDGEYKSVAYGNIVGILIEAIKELETQIQQLKNN